MFWFRSLLAREESQIYTIKSCVSSLSSFCVSFFNRTRNQLPSDYSIAFDHKLFVSSHLPLKTTSLQHQAPSNATKQITMALNIDFSLYESNSHSNLAPLIPSSHSVADQEGEQALLRWNTLYSTIFTNLNTKVASTRSFHRKTRIQYFECCAYAPPYLAEFAQTHTPTDLSRETAMMAYHQRNRAGAVRDAHSRVWGAKHQLSLFLQWANNPQKEVTEDDLAEYLQKLHFAAAQGCEAMGRTWGMITPPITPPSTTPPSTTPAQLSPQLSSLLADLTRSDRDILTDAQAAEKWQTTREKTETWLHNVEEPGIIIDPGEIEDIPLYDAPITQEIIDTVYIGEYKDEYDYDVWQDTQRRMRGW
jgi:hypothetical protein